MYFDKIEKVSWLAKVELDLFFEPVAPIHQHSQPKQDGKNIQKNLP